MCTSGDGSWNWKWIKSDSKSGDMATAWEQGIEYNAHTERSNKWKRLGVQTLARVLYIEKEKQASKQTNKQNKTRQRKNKNKKAARLHQRESLFLRQKILTRNKLAKSHLNRSEAEANRQHNEWIIIPAWKNNRNKFHWMLILRPETRTKSQTQQQSLSWLWACNHAANSIQHRWA